ncbi:MAG: hypothetical protein ACTSX1_14050, partial [Candidatus Heimdallarchaeaceae archaeon]
FLGLCALVIQLSILWEFTTITEAAYGFSTYRTFFGFRIDYMTIAHEYLWVLYFVFSLLVILWTSASFLLINKKNGQFLPRFKLPNIRIKWKSLLLLLIVLLSVLGSRPHESFYDRGYGSNTSLFQMESTVEIPSSGTIFLVVYSNDSLADNWYFTWRPTNGDLIILYESDFDNVSNNIDHTTYTYALDVTSSGILEFSWDLSNYIDEYDDYAQLLNESRIGPSAYWNARAPWFPTTTEIFILILTVLNLFLSWDSSKVKRKKQKISLKKENI